MIKNFNPFGKKTEKMMTTENEKNTDTGTADADVEQPQETTEAENTSQEQKQASQQGAATSEKTAATQWELQHPDWQRSVFLTEQNHKHIKTWITHGTQIRRVGSEEWIPIREYLFPEDTEAPAASSDAVASEVKTLIESLQAEIQRLAGEMEYTKQFSTNQKAQIDQLYKENREYKDGIIVKFKEALTKAVIEQLDFTDKKVADYKEGTVSQEDFIASCCEFADDFRNVLQNRLDMTCFLPEPGEDVDLKKHKVIRTQITDDPSQHKKIAVAQRYGYENEDGKIVRPAFVETFEYTAPSADQQSEPVDEVTPTEQTEPSNPPETSGS